MATGVTRDSSRDTERHQMGLDVHTSCIRIGPSPRSTSSP